MGLKGDLAKALERALVECEGRWHAPALVERMFELAATDPCIVRAGAEEPLFTLRAKDRLAPDVVRLWAAMLLRTQMEGAPGPLPNAKVREALKCAQTMEAWQRAHGCKVPD